MSSRLFTINLLFLIFTEILYKTIKKKINLLDHFFFTIQLSVSLECMTKFQLEIGLTLYCFDIYNALQSINKLSIKMCELIVLISLELRGYPTNKLTLKKHSRIGGGNQIISIYH